MKVMVDDYGSLSTICIECAMYEEEMKMYMFDMSIF
jgi:hypothetical protein